MKQQSYRPSKLLSNTSGSNIQLSVIQTHTKYSLNELKGEFKVELTNLSRYMILSIITKLNVSRNLFFKKIRNQRTKLIKLVEIF